MTRPHLIFGPPLLAASLALAATSLAHGAQAKAQTPEAKGEAIAREMDRRDTGFRDSRAMLEMVLRDRQGASSTRRLRIDTLETASEDDGDKTLIVFDHPRDIAGTALLTHTHIADLDDQWLYLPALRRVKRISSANRSGSFVGSEFAYEDLLSQEAAKYRHRWLRNEACGELDCFVLERVPRYEHSGYNRQVIWIDRTHYRPMKIAYYDRKDSLLKTLTFRDYRPYRSRYWRAHDMFMENRQTGKTTRLRFKSIALGVGLREQDFTPQRLERRR